MSDIKRVVLTTLEPQKVNDKPVKKQCKTVRVCVVLPESNEDKCPEFNYKDEVAAVKKKCKQSNKESNSSQNGLDIFDNDDDVKRIALEMEAKYGSGVTGPKKKRKGRKDDYADIGAGYDESDSFIDNTDGYDEIIPHNVTTVRGGFYINSGALEFKTDDEATSEVSSSSSEEESDSEEGDKSKPKRKRALDTSDEEEASDDSSPVEKIQNDPKPNISMHQAIKKKLFSTEKIQVKKRRLANQQKKSVKDLLREKRTDNPSVAPSNDVTEKDSTKENKKPMKLSSVTDAIESVISGIDENKPPDSSETKPEEPQVAKNEDVLIKSVESSQKPESDITNGTKHETQTLEIIRLPENLPSDILEIIQNIKKAAREYKDGGKVKFFSGEVNNLLLNLERKCKCLGRSSRVKVYEHLSPFVRCRKETLLKRAKNLVMEDEQKKLRNTVDKLKCQINQVVPSLIANYEKECQRVLQRKFSQEAATNEELKNLKAPRRKFPLSEEIKRMIKDIMGYKKRCFLHEGKPKEALEDLLTEYLKKEIIILWPEGWMSMTVLKKFCSNSALKTPDPKVLTNTYSNKHSQKVVTSTTNVINLGSGNSNLTITPINLTEKLNEVSNNNFSQKPEISAQVIHKEKVEKQKEFTDNGVIVVHNPGKTKHEAVIPKPVPYQVIDLTDTFAKDSILSGNFETSLKNKFTTNAANAHDKDDVQKVMESLKALQKLSAPKNETNSSPVSVIAFNKNYSNSNSSHNNGASGERTNFSGVVGFQDEFQKQFIGSLNNIKSQPASKSSYKGCS